MPAVFKVDETSPTLAPTVSPNPVLLHGTATVSANASDGGSGIDVGSVSCGSVDSSSVGVKQVGCSAKDVAGNSGQGTGTYTVGYKFLGFGPKPLPTTWHPGANLVGQVRARRRERRPARRHASSRRSRRRAGRRCS